MRSLTITLILFSFTIGALVGEQEKVFAKRGTTLVLNSSQIEQDEQFNTLHWSHGSVTVISIGSDNILNVVSPEFRKTVEVTETSLEFLDLKMSDSGTWNSTTIVSAANMSQKVVVKKRSHVLIVQDVPSAPNMPEVSNMKSRQVTVTWTDGLTDNKSPIELYKVIISECSPAADDPKGGTEERTTPHRSMVVTGLKVFTCYTIRVMSKNGIGFSARGQSSHMFYTEQEAPDAAPIDFITTAISSSEVQLLWSSPPKDLLNGELKGYLISYRKSGDILQTSDPVEPDRTNFTIQSLEAYTMYSVYITAFNSAGHGPEEAKSVQTKQGKPGKPLITHISHRHYNSFYVNWEPPTVTNGVLKRYVLQWGITGHQKNTTSRFIKGHLMKTMTAFIKDLTPYTQYYVRVAAETGGGLGPFTDKYPALTDVMSPGPPRSLNVSVLDTNSIHLSWQAPLVYYKTIDNYLIKGWDHFGTHYKEMVRGNLLEIMC